MKVKLLHPDAKLPTGATDGSAGFDLYSIETFTLYHGIRGICKTGIALEIDHGFYGKIEPRSGLAVNQGIDCMAGVIDSDYRGEIKALLINTSQCSHNIKAGDRIAQLIIQPCYTGGLELADELSETGRGSGGFQSTGR